MKRKGKSKPNHWWTDESPVSAKVIEAVGLELKVSFPKGFIAIASKYNGGSPDRDIFDAGEREECVFEYLLKFPDEFHEFYADVKKRLPKGVVPFATDPFGNALCFDYRENGSEGDPAIVFWDHEATPKSAKSICHLADSFDTFVDGVLYEI